MTTTEISSKNDPSREAIDRLQEAMAELPQVVFSTDHDFADGMYCRSMMQPEGTMLVGKIHKKEHFFIVCCGTVRVVNDEGDSRDITGPAIIVSPPGTRRAILAMTDTTYLNVHRTELTDIDEIESELIESDSRSLFDAHNMPKPGVLTLVQIGRIA